MPKIHIEHNKDLQSSEFLLCPTCSGSGRVVIGHGVVCMELIEKIVKCSDCGGKGYSKRHELPEK